MGFSEKEIGHMSIYKWERLYDIYKKTFNYEKRAFYKMPEPEEDEDYEFINF